MFKMDIYKNGRKSHTLTGKKSVLPLFRIDIGSACTRVIKRNIKSVIVHFPGDKYAITYTVPIEYIGK